MKTITMIIVFVCITSIAMANIMKFETSKGTVEFNHRMHSAMAMDNCIQCHNVENVNAKKANHTFCKGCHKTMKKGPTKCSGCHIKE